MKIRLISDIHCEFDYRNPHGEFFPPELRDDPDTVLVAAGDIHVGENAAFWLNRMASRFRAVIYVTGNHEYYHSCLYPDSEWLAMYLEHDNIHILQGEQVGIDEFDFIGATLWTDFDRENPLLIASSPQSLSDFQVIYESPDSDAPISPYAILETHYDHRNKILNLLQTSIENKRRPVVVTHHLPSWQCVTERFRRPPYNKLNGFFATDLDAEIEQYQPELWMFGHTHDSIDIHIGKTRLLCNPRGYYPYELNPRFDSLLTVNLD